MTINVQKLSSPSEEWTIDVESSDTIEGIKQKLRHEEAPGVYDYLKINLFKDGTELLNEYTLTYYGVQKLNHLTSSYDSSDCNPIFDKFAYGDEDGCERFRRLRLLGYI